MRSRVRQGRQLLRRRVTVTIGGFGCPATDYPIMRVTPPPYCAEQGRGVLCPPRPEPLLWQNS